jgi:hypothetical protein
MPEWATVPLSAVGSDTWLIAQMRGLSRRERLMELVQVVAAAMEHCRKRRGDAYVNTMAQGVLLAFAIADIDQIDLLDVIAQKRAFNATRSDHKVENRKADGGKQF